MFIQVDLVYLCCAKPVFIPPSGTAREGVGECVPPAVVGPQGQSVDTRRRAVGGERGDHPTTGPARTSSDRPAAPSNTGSVTYTIVL